MPLRWQPCTRSCRFTHMAAPLTVPAWHATSHADAVIAPTHHSCRPHPPQLPPTTPAIALIYPGRPLLTFVPLPCPALPQTPPCNVTWAEAAKQQAGLSLLATVLGQDAIAKQLPGPGSPNTLFAPTDTAFFNMLATLSE